MLIEIEDPADPRLADYRLLRGAAALRTHDADEFFVAEGWAPIARTVDSRHRLRSLLLEPSRVGRLARELPALAAPSSQVPVYLLHREALAESVGFDLHRGVLASADRRPAVTLDDLVRGPATRLAVLEGLTDAENVGVIARSVRALGVGGLVLDPTCIDPYHRRTVRVSMGEVLHLPCARSHDWPDGLDHLAAAGFESWALTPDAVAEDLWTVPVPPRLAVVLGSEGPGLSPGALDRATRRVRIPIAADVDSLNVGHAAAIAFAVTNRPGAR